LYGPVIEDNLPDLVAFGDQEAIFGFSRLILAAAELIFVMDS
jgi:hypothetical protein